MLKTTAKIEVKCGGCGCSVIRKPSAIRSVVVYCSHKCHARIQFADRQAQQLISRRSRKQRIELKCEHCNANFFSRPEANRKFCSRKCFGATRFHRLAATCLQCGDCFQSRSNQLLRLNRRFCSRSCWSKYRMTGERNRNWKGGISSARDVIKASDQYKEWRLQVFRRDHFHCVVCLCPSSDGNPIEAHHLKKFSDYPGLVLDVENGCTLCRKCHKQTYQCEYLLESFLRSRILRDFTSDVHVPLDMLKIKSGLHGDMQRSAEMSDPA